MKNLLLFCLFAIFLSSFAQAIIGEGCTAQPGFINEISEAEYNTTFPEYKDQCIEMGPGIYPNTNTYYCCKEKNKI